MSEDAELQAALAMSTDAEREAKPEQKPEVTDETLSCAYDGLVLQTPV